MHLCSASTCRSSTTFVAPLNEIVMHHVSTSTWLARGTTALFVNVAARCCAARQVLAGDAYLKGFQPGRKPSQLYDPFATLGRILALGPTQGRSRMHAQVPQPGQTCKAATLHRQQRAVSRHVYGFVPGKRRDHGPMYRSIMLTGEQTWSEIRMVIGTKRAPGLKAWHGCDA